VILATACIAMALWFTSCGGGGSTAAVPVSTAGFSASPTSVTFGSQAVGTTSAAQSATLINVGDATLTISSIQVTGPNAGDYTLTSTCGSSLAPSAQCTLSVMFTPTAAGTRTASVVFTDNAEAVRVPAAVGVNMTLSVHWADGASEEPQVLVKV